MTDFIIVGTGPSEGTLDVPTVQVVPDCVDMLIHS